MPRVELGGAFGVMYSHVCLRRRFLVLMSGMNIGHFAPVDAGKFQNTGKY